MKRIIENLKDLENNWVSKTHKEKVNGIREAVVDLDNAVYHDEISKEEILEVTSFINHLMMFL